MSKMEELFEKKLADHTLTPSPAAWESIEAGLSKKNKPMVWVRWAAAFLLAGLLFTAWWLRKPDENLPIANNIPETPGKKDTVIKESKPALAAVTKKSRTSNSVKKSTRTQPPVTQKIEEVLPEEKPNNKPVEVAIVNVPETIEKKTAPPASKPIVLVYTLESIGPSEHTTTPEPVTADKKEGIKKMMLFARDVKNGDSPLGIRDMKDELFALDFKKSTKKQH